MDARKYVAKLSALPYVSSYSAFAYLRTLQVLKCVTLTNAEVPAGTMSGSVEVLTQICPWTAWCQGVRSIMSKISASSQPGDVALIICETAKALRSLGLAVPKNSAEDSTGFVQDFGSGCGWALLECLQNCQPLSLDDVRSEHGIRSTEAGLVDTHFPKTRARWDREPHVCRGSETLVPLLRAQMLRLGFLTASGNSDV